MIKLTKAGEELMKDFGLSYKKLSDDRKALLEACKLAFERLKPKGNVTKDFNGHVAMATLSKAIVEAEEN